MESRGHWHDGSSASLAVAHYILYPSGILSPADLVSSVSTIFAANTVTLRCNLAWQVHLSSLQSLLLEEE